MEKIKDQRLLKSYFDKYKIMDIFDEKVTEYMELLSVKKGELILEADSEIRYFYLLVEGQIKISYSFENGKSMVLKFGKALKCFGELEILQNMSVACNVEAVEDSYILIISAENIKKHYLKNINFLTYLTTSLSEKLHETINNTSYNFVYPLENRLASYLLEYMTEKNYILLNASFQEIAEFLGTTYRHLNRMFNDFEAKTLIKREDKKIYILDKDRIKELSKNMYMQTL